MQSHLLNQTVQPSWPFASRKLSFEPDSKRPMQPTYTDYQVNVEKESSHKPSTQIRVLGRVLIPSNLVRV